MDAQTAALGTVLALSVCHLRIRRSPRWTTTPAARFFVSAGYPAVLIAVFWLTQARSAVSWEWVLGNVWALLATILLVRGLDLLNIPAAVDCTSPRSRASTFPVPTTARRH